jgi:hypothetical protein
LAHKFIETLPGAYFFTTIWLTIISAKPADNLPTDWQGEPEILKLDSESDDCSEFQLVTYPEQEPQQESTAASAFEWPDINPEDKWIYQ